MELGRTFVKFRFGGSATEVLYLVNDDQKERYLLPTIAGEKMWITFGDHAEYGLTFCRTPDEPEGGITAFLIDRSLRWKSTLIPPTDSTCPAMVSFVADSEIHLRAMKLLSLHASWLHDSGRDPRQAANSMKYFGANAVNRIVDRVMQIHGGMGYAKEMPIERYYRDLRVERIYEGSDEIQLLSIIRNLVRSHDRVGQL